MVRAKLGAGGKSRARAKGVRASPLTVCLLSSHAGVLEVLNRLLSGLAFRIKSLKLNLVPGFDPEGVPFPRAPVYVVDASGPQSDMQTLVGQLRKRFPHTHLVVLNETTQDERVFPYLRLGVKGIIRYTDVPSQLPRAVRMVAEGGFWVPRAILARFVEWISPDPAALSVEWRGTKLSRREREVLDRLLEGLANKEIADRLHISERTVKFHVGNVLAKFKVRRRADLILMLSLIHI